MLSYTCKDNQSHYDEQACQSLTGPPLDQLVSELVLQALQPAALEISLQVADDLESERQRLHLQWAQRLERARFEAERAYRQFDAVEPEHRLVGRTLERQWEETLAAEDELKADYQRFCNKQPTLLSTQERETIRQLASDIPALWSAPETTTADRQAIIRQLVERIIVTIEGQTEKVDVQVHWFGGQGTQTTLIRPVARLEQLSYYSELLQRVATIFNEGYDGDTISAILNREGW